MSKTDKRKNKYWRKRWLDVVKYDQDWDWRYFMDIIIRKLQLLRERYDNSVEPPLEGSRDDRVRLEIRRLLELGREIQSETNTYLEKAARILDVHNSFEQTTITLGGQETAAYRGRWEAKDGDPKGWKKEYDDLTKKGEERLQEAVKEFFAGLGSIILDLWD